MLTGADTGDSGPAGGFIVDAEHYDSGSLLIRFRDDVRVQETNWGPSRTPFPFAMNVGAGFELLPSLHKVALPDYVDVKTALELLRDHADVLYAEPNYRIQLSATPNDPRFDELWGLNNEGQSGGTFDADIDAAEAWDATVGSSDTIVAVIDTGVDYLHPDLAANMWVNPGEIPHNGLDDDGNGFVDDIHGYDFANHDGDPMDDHNHGTHVAGTIAAVGNNGIGVTGINWHAQIMALKFLDASGNGDTDDAIDALNYAVANGARISNNSWGFSDGFAQSLYDAIQAARDDDHVFVAAAGNGNIFGFGINNDSQPFYPASYNLPNIISVAAVDRNDSKPLFSNYGLTTVDLGAPGVDILSTVRNGGYGLSSGTSMASPHVAGVIALVRGQHPEWGYAQVINQVLQTVDPVSSMDGKTVTGGRLNAASAVGVEVVPAPEIQVLLGTQNVADDAAVIDYGNTPPGLPIDFTFTVQNKGVMPLNLAEPITVPTGFSLAAGFGSTRLEVGASTTFSVRLNGDVEGTYIGEVSFGNDDPDENPFNFTVNGTVAVPPAVQIVDNGDSGFDSSGEWYVWTGQGFQNDVHESLPGTGTDTARWTFQRLLPGTYRVAATWASYTNRATNAPFTVLDDDLSLGTVLVNQQLAPSGLSDAEATWQYLGGPYTIDGNTLVVQLRDNADGRLNADAIRIERIDQTPEVEVRQQDTMIPDNAGVFDFGAATTGVPLSYTFTVQNVGGSALTLSEPISVPSGFSLVSSFGSTSLATDETTSFTIKLDAVSAGIYSGEVSFENNDADEALFSFTVQGTVADPPAVQIIDNGDAAFSTVGAWTRWTGQGYENDIHESLPGAGANLAGWTFLNLLPGYYRVAATWTTHSNRATNAPFEILDGADSQQLVLVNQQIAPNDFSDAGANWELLGAPILANNGNLVVRLSDAADGRLNADAIRIERVVQAPEILVSAAGTELIDGVSTFDFGNTPPGIPAIRSITVENTGTEALVLDEPITVSAGFSLVSGFASTTLQPGEMTSFVIRFDASADGATTGEIAFGNNDPDENPFSFSVTGAVQVPPAVQVIDDGDVGFVTVGEWTRWTGQGFANDIDESLAGTGTDVASWTFTGLMPGRYRVAATWKEYSNRATNAPFTILDDTTPLTTIYVNQQLAPSGFSDAGASWQYLGSVHQIAGHTLTVRLNDSANGRLNADAIRLQRLDPVPEIQVSQGTTSLVDAVSVVDFGSTSIAAPVSMTFTVTNLGGEVLNLSEPISVPAGFRVVSSFGTTALATDQSTTFVLQLDATSVGTSSGSVSFGNSDADEGPFDFAVQGTVLSPPSVVIADNGDTGFTAVGQWQRWTGQGYLSDIHESLAGTGADVASWTFPNLLPGTYRVSATWTAYTNRASNSPFTILDDATIVGSVTVNQRLAPSQFADAGVYWNDLGSSYQISSGKLVVRLSDNANGRVNADAIRIERLAGVAGGASFGDSLDTSATDTSHQAFQALVTSAVGTLTASAQSTIGWAESLRDWARHPSLSGGRNGLDSVRTLRERLFTDWPEREDLLDELLSLLADESTTLDIRASR